MSHAINPRLVLANGLTLLVFLIMLVFFPAASSAGDPEYLGTLESELVPNTQDMDQVTFRPVRDLSKIKTAKPFGQGLSITAGRLYHPPSDKSSILAALAEAGERPPPG